MPITTWEMLLKSGEIFQEFYLYLNKAISIKPDYLEAHNSMAVALIAQGKFDEAKAYCEKALSLEPDNSQCLNFNRCQTYFIFTKWENN